MGVVASDSHLAGAQRCVVDGTWRTGFAIDAASSVAKSTLASCRREQMHVIVCSEVCRKITARCGFIAVSFTAARNGATGWK
ncbi:hypothetical protein, partial [Micromonospora noduli]|uniref:hypothetical protein n=1 Tax=Micromonospora noduli TaxID=709876 RepID=UPI001CED4684